MIHDIIGKAWPRSSSPQLYNIQVILLSFAFQRLNGLNVIQLGRTWHRPGLSNDIMSCILALILCCLISDCLLKKEARGQVVKPCRSLFQLSCAGTANPRTLSHASQRKKSGICGYSTLEERCQGDNGCCIQKGKKGVSPPPPIAAFYRVNLLSLIS